MLRGCVLTVLAPALSNMSLTQQSAPRAPLLADLHQSNGLTCAPCHADNLPKSPAADQTRIDCHGGVAAVRLPPDGLDATEQHYNGYAQAHNDEQFGRAPGSIGALQTPPFYAMELTPSFINTQGGPRRNKDAQIVDVAGNPIPRLYSSGEVGSIHGFQYNGGGNLGECVAFGRIAGQNAAKQKPWAQA